MKRILMSLSSAIVFFYFLKYTKEFSKFCIMNMKYMNEVWHFKKIMAISFILFVSTLIYIVTKMADKINED